MAIENQVLVIWAASNGYTDDIAVEDVRGFEAELLKFIENSHPGLLQNIREKKSLTDEIKSDLQVALKDFKDIWKEKNEAKESDVAAATATA
jgi:F-type H+-transporting ATPase subunit alpha